ncbi:TRAP transporter small permease [Rubrivirga sp. IMCC45206]|uniref:TRAP transporter small permease n=1 Tax=Rubrivirga sp. IMCC45206 TaxID=3391614 RepID=UPI00398F9BB3
MTDASTPPTRGFTAALDRALAALLIGLTVVMVVTVSWQVATRFLLNSPSSYTEELATFLLLWISLLGAAYALRQGAHLGIDVVVAQLALPVRRRARVASYVVVAVFSIVALVVGGGLLVRVTFELGQRSAAFQVPMGVVYLALPLSGLLMAYYAAVGAAETLRGTRPPDDTSGASEPPDTIRLVD